MNQDETCCPNTSMKLVYVCQVSPLIINTVITILSVLSPATETPEKLDSPVSIDLWEKRSWKDLKFWFLEEFRDEDTKSVAPLVPQGESLQVLYYVHLRFTTKQLVLCNSFFHTWHIDLWVSILADEYQIYLSDLGSWSGTSHHPHASCQVILPWRCEKLVHIN